MQAAAIILAGGKSTRMGNDKSFIQLSPTHPFFIERVVAEVRSSFEQIVVVTNCPERYVFLDVELTPDLIPGRGPFSGIHAGLTVCRYEYALVLACDLPFVDGRLGRFLLNEARGFDVAVLRSGTYLQPLYAVYARRCLAQINAYLEQGNNKITSFFPLVRVNYIDTEQLEGFGDLEAILYNVNTPSDLEEARRLLDSKTSQ